MYYIIFKEIGVINWYNFQSMYISKVSNIEKF